MLAMEGNDQNGQNERNETRYLPDMLDALIDNNLPHSNSEIQIQSQEGGTQRSSSQIQETIFHFSDHYAKKRRVQDLYELRDQQTNPPYTGIYNKRDGYFGYFNKNSNSASVKNLVTTKFKNNTAKNNQKMVGIHQKHPYNLSTPSTSNTYKFNDCYPPNAPVQMQTSLEQYHNWTGPVVQYEDIDIDQLEKLLNDDRFSESETETDLSSSSSSSLCYNLNALVPDDLKTPYSTRRGKIPRLLKHDLRRFYPAMFINVLNAQDEMLLSQYFERFYVPQTNLKLLYDLADVWTANNKPTAQGGIVCGRSSVVDYFQVLFHSYPDLIFTLSDVDITRNNYNHKCTLKMRMKIQWTQMVPTVVPIDDVEEQEEQQQMEKNGTKERGSDHLELQKEENEEDIMDVDDVPVLQRQEETRNMVTDSEETEENVVYKGVKEVDGDTDSTGEEDDEEDMKKIYKSFSSQKYHRRATTCEMPMVMQMQQAQLLNNKNDIINNSTNKKKIDSHNNVFKNLDKSNAEEIEGISTQKARKTRILWEKIAFEVHADVPFVLDEDWYITQIDSATLSRTLDKVQMNQAAAKKQPDKRN